MNAGSECLTDAPGTSEMEFQRLGVGGKGVSMDEDQALKRALQTKRPGIAKQKRGRGRKRSRKLSSNGAASAGVKCQFHLSSMSRPCPRSAGLRVICILFSCRSFEYFSPFSLLPIVSGSASAMCLRHQPEVKRGEWTVA